MLFLKKGILRTLLSIGIFLTLYFLFAILLSVIPTRPKVINCEQKESIYLTTSGVHLDIILKKKQLDTIFQRALALEEEVEYVAFGWGDRAFYLNTPTWADFKVSTFLKALFISTPSLMHVTEYKAKTNEMMEVKVCPTQLNSLITHINKGFSRDSEGEIMKIGTQGYTKQDDFYEGDGIYSCFKTCNEWVNMGFKEASIKTAIWSPFDKGVLMQVVVVK